MTNKTPVSRETMDRCPGIRLIAVMAVSYTHLVFWYRFPLLKKAHARSEFHEEEGYEKFCMESWYWLNDYALYMACLLYTSFTDVIYLLLNYGCTRT